MQNKNRNINHSRVFLSGISTLLKGKADETPDTNFWGWIKAFTLIELLVVVLIIGILAAVAVPQYNKAVVKSRVATILPVLKTIKNAEEVYHMANGAYTTDVSELGVQLPANCSAMEGGDGGLYQCGDMFLLDLDAERTNGKIIANYCPGVASSKKTCDETRPFQFRFYYVYNTANGVADKLVCIPLKDEGKKICKSLGSPFVSGECVSNMTGCTEL